MKKIFKKITIIIVGFIVIVLFLEISLRVLGYIHLKQREDTRDIGDGEYVILCLGDSYTEGLGAPMGEGYPEQLERLFNSKFSDKEFKVINRGIGATSTVMLLRKFEEYLDEVNPDIIILLIGWVNYWNFYHYPKMAIPYDIKTGYPVVSRMQLFLYRIRVYQLMRLIFANLRQKKYNFDIKKELESIEYNKYKEKTEDVYNFKYLGFMYKLRGEMEKAKQFFEAVLNINPYDRDARIAILDIYFKNLLRYHHHENKLVPMIKESIKLIPEELIFFQIFIHLCRVDKSFYRENLDFLDKIKHKNPVAGDVIEAMKEDKKGEEKIKNWIIRDIQKMIDISKDRGIKMMLHDYPIEYVLHLDYHSPDELYYSILTNTILEKVARNNSIPFINHNAVFGYMQSQGINIKDYFAPDLHCNEKGYKVMAENIYNKIIEERLIDFN